ncbi:hypothetical protein [Bradyrhizobium sp. 159]|uniref:hypothetical protein n=1 Tax=Bradyrhizobium sp. 159 TaxID=2782632 RepID=UPI001FF78566|nr:hypothetical protein [Bradyrhizobium sp. 159]
MKSAGADRRARARGERIARHARKEVLPRRARDQPAHGGLQVFGSALPLAQAMVATLEKSDIGRELAAALKMLLSAVTRGWQRRCGNCRIPPS